MADRRRTFVVAGLLAVAGGAAWLALVGLDPGDLDVPEAPPAPAPADAATADLGAVDRLPTPPAPAPIDPPGVGWPEPPRVDGVPIVPPGPTLPADPEMAQRILSATGDALSRRLEMTERIFQGAALGVVDEGEREQVGAVLDDTLERMRGLEAKVADGSLPYRDALKQMEALRDAAGARITSMISPEEADTVRLRMGIRPPPDPAEVQAWDGVPFEEGMRDF